MIFDTILTKLNPYVLYIKIAGIILVFLAGCYVTRLYYVAKLDAQIIATQKAEAELATAGSKIEVKFIHDVEKVEVKGKDREVKVTEYVPKIEYVTSNTCDKSDKVTAGFVEFHNAAVDDRELIPMTTTDVSKSSDVTIDKFAITLNANYVACNKNIKQIEALQEFLREVENKTK